MQPYINAIGYSDTNWGELLPFFSKYEWGQYNDNDTSFVFGIVYGLWRVRYTYFYMRLGKEKIIIENNGTSHSKHTEWKRDKSTGVKIPNKTIITFKNKEYTVRLSLKLLMHDTMALKISSLLPKPIVSEQISEYQGTVEKNGKIIHEFKGRGFKEWSAKTWKKVPLLF